jgi:hypothetical protein
MIPDIDIFIGLSLDAKDNNYNPAVIKEKADWFNSSLSALKTLAKSDEAIANAFPTIKSLMV